MAIIKNFNADESNMGEIKFKVLKLEDGDHVKIWFDLEDYYFELDLKTESARELGKILSTI